MRFHHKCQTSPLIQPMTTISTSFFNLMFSIHHVNWKPKNTKRSKILRLGNEIKIIGITTSDKALTTKLLEGDPEAETSRAERDRELLLRSWKPIGTPTSSTEAATRGPRRPCVPWASGRRGKEPSQPCRRSTPTLASLGCD